MPFARFTVSLLALPALAAHPQAAGADAARTQQRVGENLCMIGQFKNGIDTYAKALQALGAN